MQAAETLERAHMQVLQAVDDLPEAMWDMPDVCGDWSVKDVVGHLAAYELLLLDYLHSIEGEQPTPYMLRHAQSQDTFNAETIKAREYHTAQQVLNEYQEAQMQTMGILTTMPGEKLEQLEITLWPQGRSTMLQIVTTLADHTRRHCEQIIAFREKNQELE